MSKRHSVKSSFGYAFSGVKEALKNEPNFRVQLFAAVIAIILGVVTKLAPYEWIILTLTIFIVLILELINTSLEALVDLVSPQTRNKAKVAKDVAAAAVLMSSIASLAVAGFLFIPKLI